MGAIALRRSLHVSHYCPRAVLQPNRYSPRPSPPPTPVRGVTADSAPTGSQQRCPRPGQRALCWVAARGARGLGRTLVHSRQGGGKDSGRCAPARAREGVVLDERWERKRNVCHRQAPASCWNPPLLGRRRPGSTQAGQGAKHAGPGLPSRPWWAPEHPSKTGPHSNREGSARE